MQIVESCCLIPLYLCSYQLPLQAVFPALKNGGIGSFRSVFAAPSGASAFRPRPVLPLRFTPLLWLASPPVQPWPAMARAMARARARPWRRTGSSGRCGGGQISMTARRRRAPVTRLLRVCRCCACSQPTVPPTPITLSPRVLVRIAPCRQPGPCARTPRCRGR